MKRILTFSLSLIMAFSFAACGESDKDTPSNGSSSSPSSSPGSTELKTTLEDGVYSDGENFKISVPDGFKESTEGVAGVMMLVPEDYPTKTDNITITMSGRMPGFESLDQAYFEDLYDSTLEGVTFGSFEKTEVDGKNAYRTEYTMTVLDVEMKGIQIMVDASNYTIVFTFTAVTEGMEAEYNKSIDSIELLGK